MDYLFDIIVLNWNQKELTTDFVNSFLANTTIPCRLIIIDNGSDDGSVEYLLSLKDTAACKFKIVVNKENLGFVGGMNQGIEISAAPYVCLANNDLLFSKGWLDEILAVFEKDERIGVLNPNSNNLGEHLNGATIESVAERLYRDFKGVFVEMPFCIGFCMFIRREVILKTGGLSKEFYPMFFEDTDYSLKASHAGYLIGLAKGSFVWHKEHGSFTRMGHSRIEIFDRSKQAFAEKWGEILRVAWILNDPSELAENLAQAVDLVRQGNYLWVFTPGEGVDRVKLFDRPGVYDHSGLHIIGFRNVLTLFWKIATKKKRYNAVIMKDGLFRLILRLCGYKTFSNYDKALLQKIKRPDAL